MINFFPLAQVHRPHLIHSLAFSPLQLSLSPPPTSRCIIDPPKKPTVVVSKTVAGVKVSEGERNFLGCEGAGGMDRWRRNNLQPESLLCGWGELLGVEDVISMSMHLSGGELSIACAPPHRSPPLSHPQPTSRIRGRCWKGVILLRSSYVTPWITYGKSTHL